MVTLFTHVSQSLTNRNNIILSLQMWRSFYPYIVHSDNTSEGPKTKLLFIYLFISMNLLYLGMSIESFIKKQTFS